MRAALTKAPEPAIRARLTALIVKYGPETVRKWAENLGAKQVSRLEAILASASEVASTDALPAVLRNPPWRKKKSKDATPDMVLSIQPIPTQFAYPEDQQA